MQGTTWSNNGQGYNTQDDANKAIQLVLQDTEEMGRNMDGGNEPDRGMFT